MSKFNYFFKMGLLLILLFSIFFLGYQLRDFTLKGRDCQSDPFLYGALYIMDNNRDYDTIDCQCLLYNKNGYGVPQNYYFSSNAGNIYRKVSNLPEINLNFNISKQ